MADIVELMASIKEYSNKDINDVEAVKAQISEILKTHRPIKLADYQYGFSFTGKKDHRLIVKEENDKTKVREYAKGKKRWFCSSKRRKCKSLSIKMIYGILFAPIQHSDKCDTKDYIYVLEVQGLLEEGKFKEVDILRSKVRRSTHNASNQSSSTSMFNESTASITGTEHDSILDQSISDDTNDSHEINMIPSESQITTPASVETDQEPSSSLCIKREIDDTEYCNEIAQPLAKKPKIEATNVETFSFEYPPPDTLKEICRKLNIPYDRNVYKFWSDIAFEKIFPVSENIKPHSFKSSNMFACFSLLLTGKMDDCFDFQKAVNRAFRKNLTDLGIKSNAEIDEICTNITVTDEHLEFICKFLTCRIGIFENGNLKKYGKWESENNDALTLILSFENGFYSVVLDL